MIDRYKAHKNIKFKLLFKIKRIFLIKLKNINISTYNYFYEWQVQQVVIFGEAIDTSK